VAINLLGSTDSRVNFGAVAIAGFTAITVAFTIRTAASLVGTFFVTKWGNLLNEQALLIDRINTDEIEVLVAQNSGSAVYYGVATTDSPVTTSTLLRVVCRMDIAGVTADIWVNGAVRSMANTFTDGPTAIGTSAGDMCVGQQPFHPADGVDGDYSEFAIWSEKVPDWVAESYGKGMSPAFYRRSTSFLYSRLSNTSDMRDIWTSGTGAHNNGIDAAHPSIYYPATPLSTFPGVVPAGGGGTIPVFMHNYRRRRAA